MRSVCFRVHEACGKAGRQAQRGNTREGSRREKARSGEIAASGAGAAEAGWHRGSGGGHGHRVSRPYLRITGKTVGISARRDDTAMMNRPYCAPLLRAAVISRKLARGGVRARGQRGRRPTDRAETECSRADADGTAARLSARAFRLKKHARRAALQESLSKRGKESGRRKKKKNIDRSAGAREVKRGVLGFRTLGARGLYNACVCRIRRMDHPGRGKKGSPSTPGLERSSARARERALKG